MRVFVFLLILANLLFLAWTQGYFGSPSNPDAFRVQQQLLADQIRVVARDEPPAETQKTENTDKPTEKKAADVCLTLNDLPIAEATQLENLLPEKLPAFKAIRTATVSGGSYWVFIPPLATKQDAENKTAELKKLRVTEFFIVQENGPNNRAISLGLFSTKEAATTYLETLRSQGVKSAKIAERNSKPTSASLEIRGPEAQAEALRQTIAHALPQSKPTECKPQATSTP